MNKQHFTEMETDFTETQSFQSVLTLSSMLFNSSKPQGNPEIGKSEEAPNRVFIRLTKYKIARSEKSKARIRT